MYFYLQLNKINEQAKWFFSMVHCKCDALRRGALCVFLLFCWLAFYFMCIFCTSIFLHFCCNFLVFFFLHFFHHIYASYTISIRIQCASSNPTNLCCEYTIFLVVSSFAFFQFFLGWWFFDLRKKRNGLIRTEKSWFICQTQCKHYIYYHFFVYVISNEISYH